MEPVVHPYLAREPRFAAKVTDPAFRPAQPDEIRQWFGAEAGSLGPVGVTNMTILADQALAGRRNMPCSMTATNAPA